MSKNYKIRLTTILLSGFFLFLDQFLKWQSLYHWTETKLVCKYFGWQPFLNSGIAFGIPIPTWLTITLTIPIIALVIFLLIKENKNKFLFLSWCLILNGAVSNLIDRIAYGYVVDYFAFVTGIINIADVMIVVGLGIYLFTSLKPKVQMRQKIAQQSN